MSSSRKKIDVCRICAACTRGTDALLAPSRADKISGEVRPWRPIAAAAVGPQSSAVIRELDMTIHFHRIKETGHSKPSGCDDEVVVDSVNVVLM